MPNFNVRLSDDQVAEIERYRAVLQETFGSSVRVTQRTVVMEALKQLRLYLEHNEETKAVIQRLFPDMLG